MDGVAVRHAGRPQAATISQTAIGCSQFTEQGTDRAEGAKAASEGKHDPTPRELEVMAGGDWKVYDVGLIVSDCLLGAIGLVTWT